MGKGSGGEGQVLIREPVEGSDNLKAIGLKDTGCDNAMRISGATLELMVFLGCKPFSEYYCGIPVDSNGKPVLVCEHQKNNYCLKTDFIRRSAVEAYNLKKINEVYRR